MNKILILIAGAPATGKTSLSEYLTRELKIVCLNKDHIKEVLVDMLGYKNRDENKRLSETTFFVIKYVAERAMIIGESIIIESNFRVNEEEYLLNLISKYNYIPITVFLSADPRTLHKRYLDREHSGSRHHAHLSADLTDFKDFKEVIEPQINFDIGGKRIILDTNELNNINYQSILKEIKEYIEKMENENEF